MAESRVAGHGTEGARPRGGTAAGGELRVTVRLFGPFRELAEAGTRELRLPAGSRVGDAVSRLRGSGLEALPPSPTVALNLEYASLEAPLSDGDEVALIPPVAGG